MQDIQVDNNFRITEKFENLNLDSQIYFYEFLNLIGICKMIKQDMLKKGDGPRRRIQARPAQICRPARAWLAEAVSRCLI
jgi:hypothetical protein